MSFWSIGSSEKVALKDEEEKKSIQLTDQPYTRDDILVCASYGHIYAVRKVDGSDIWDTKFPTGVLGGIISIFITDTDKLIVGGLGKTVCMNLLTGQTIWINKMVGFGYEQVSVLSTPSQFLPPIKHPHEIDAPPSYHGDQDKASNGDKPIIFACSRGKVMGIDSSSGDTLWTYNCPGGRFRIPTALIEPPSAENSMEEGIVYVGASKHLYCLKAQTGEVLWKRQLANFIFGQGFMTMATHWSSRLAAEAYTAFSQNPVAQVRDLERDSEQSGG